MKAVLISRECRNIPDYFASDSPHTHRFLLHLLFPQATSMNHLRTHHSTFVRSKLFAKGNLYLSLSLQVLPDDIEYWRSLQWLRGENYWTSTNLKQIIYRKAVIVHGTASDSSVKSSCRLLDFSNSSLAASKVSTIFIYLLIHLFHLFKPFAYLHNCIFIKAHREYPKYQR